MPQLSCGQLQALPAFINTISIEEALEVMRRADHWQRTSMQTATSNKEKAEESVRMRIFRLTSSRFYLFRRKAKGLVSGTDGSSTSMMSFMSSLTLLIMSYDNL